MQYILGERSFLSARARKGNFALGFCVASLNCILKGNEGLVPIVLCPVFITPKLSFLPRRKGANGCTLLLAKSFQLTVEVDFLQVLTTYSRKQVSWLSFSLIQCPAHLVEMKQIVCTKYSIEYVILISLTVLVIIGACLRCVCSSLSISHPISKLKLFLYSVMSPYWAINYFIQMSWVWKSVIRNDSVATVLYELFLKALFYNGLSNAC